MYKVMLELRPKHDISLKESYEVIATLIRQFIVTNDKDLKMEHYKPMFSYYSFSNMHPLESDMVYKKNGVYTVELRSLKREFLDLKNYSNLETDSLQLLSASGGKLFHLGTGKIYTETPVFLDTKPIKSEEYLLEVKEKIKENILFRYLKSGMNQSNDINTLRTGLIKDIKIEQKIVTIPFQKKVLRNGNPFLYHCLKMEVEFNDVPYAKEAEKVIYAGGLGKNTSNGFGFIKQARSPLYVYN